MGQVLIDTLSLTLLQSGVDPAAWALGWARLLPSVLLVPAFGLRTLPLFARLLFALILAACVAPSLAPLVSTEQPWLFVLFTQVAIGLPVALSAAVTLWAATMTGNLLDEVRGGAPFHSEMASVDSAASPLGVLLSLGAAAAFLKLGGASRLAEALAGPGPLSPQSMPDVARNLVQGIQIAVLIAAPLLVVAAFFELVHGLIARSANPARLSSSLAPLRALALLVIVALLFDRVVEGLVLWMDGHLPRG